MKTKMKTIKSRKPHSEKSLLKGTTLMVVVLLIVLTLSTLASAESYRDYVNTPINPGSLPSQGNLLTDLNSGAATFSYGIKTPPGTNSLQPALALTYNSHEKNSYPELVGSGWSLTQSYIQRNVEHTPDNAEDDTDFLVFHGQKYELFYDENDGQYHTNPESFMSIQTFRGGQGQQQIYAIVTTKDGTKYRFGYNRDSEMYSNQHAFGWRWYLDQVEDTHENKIFYTYREDPYPGDVGVTYLDRIAYNNGRERVINFDYEPLPRSWAIFDEGHKVKRTHRLREIRITANNQVVRKYSIAYVTNEQQTRSYISSITQFGNNNVALPATRFTYYGENKGWERDVALEAELPDVWFSWDEMDDGTRVTDLNRDGKTDILTNSEGGFSGRSAYINYGDDFRRGGNFQPPRDANFIYEDDGLFYDNGVRLADYDGDGHDDLIKSNSGNSQMWRNTGEQWEAVNRRFVTPFIRQERIRGEFTQTDLGVRLVDLNGDRLADVVKAMAEDEGEQAWINTGNGWDPAENWIIPNHVRFVDGFGRDLGVRLADINGDGLVDLYNGANRQEAELWLNTGAEWVGDEEWDLANLEDTIWRVGEDNGVRISDINGDGLSDMVVAKGMLREAFINVGEGWVVDPAWNVPPEAEFVTRDGENEGTRLFDITGDGAVDIVTLRTGLENNPIKRIWKNRASKQMLLQEVVLPEGGTYTITYHNSGEDDDGGTTHDMGFTLWVVDAVTHRDFGVHHTAGNPDGTTSTRYYYLRGKYDFVDDKFLGFYSVEERLPDGTLIKHYYEQDEGMGGREFRIDTYDADENLLRTEEYTWDAVRRGAQRGHAYYVTTLTRGQQTDYIPARNGQKRKGNSYQYDQYGNLIEIHYEGDLETNADDYYEQFAYTYNRDDWIVDKVRNYKKIKADHRTVVSEEWVYYDNNRDNDAVPTQGEVTKRIVWLDNGNNPEIRYAYDDHGNLREMIDARGNRISYAYDPTGTFVMTVTNALGHAYEFVHDLGTGNLLSRGDPNGYETVYLYDAFGRKVSEVREGDLLNSPTKSWIYDFDGGVPEKITEASKIADGQYMETISLYDGFGFKIQQRKKRDNGRQIVKDYYYDARGRLSDISNPYDAPYQNNYRQPSRDIWQSQLKTSYRYDALGRLTILALPDDVANRISYEGWDATTRDGNNQPKNYYHDAWGRIIRIDESVNNQILSTNYEYDLNSNILEIEDAQGNQISFAYDSLGRLQERDDPDTGEWQYRYDANGNIISQTDANGNEITLSHDELNRVTEKRVGEQVIAYHYDEDTIGQITSISTPDMSVSYVYDERLRPTRERKTISGTPFEITYAYDGLNRITEKDMGGEEITFEYGKEGLTNLNGEVNIHYDEFGYPSERIYQNGLTTNLELSQRNHKLVYIRTQGKQDLTYIYDRAGNVQEINDRQNQYVLSLAYDSLNRLTSAQKRANNRNAGNADFTARYTYDALGNMLTAAVDNQAYTFSYGGTPIHSPIRVNAPQSPLQCEEHERVFGFACVAEEGNNEGNENGDDGPPDNVDVQQGCEHDNHCQDNQQCVQNECLEREEVNENQPPPVPPACRQDSHCEQGLICVENKCISRSEQDLNFLPDLTIPRFFLLNPEKVEQGEKAVYELTIQNIGKTGAEEISWNIINAQTGEELAKSGNNPIRHLGDERKVIIYPTFTQPCETIRAEVDYLKNIREQSEENNRKDARYEGGICKGKYTEKKSRGEKNSGNREDTQTETGREEAEKKEKPTDTFFMKVIQKNKKSDGQSHKKTKKKQKKSEEEKRWK